eukprot:symbB.v1.2.032383.t1/scaffold3856.1/size95938/1
MQRMATRRFVTVLGNRSRPCLRTAASVADARWPERSVIHEPAWDKQTLPIPSFVMNLANMFETYFVLREAKILFV